MNESPNLRKRSSRGALADRESRLVALLVALAFLIVGLPRVFTGAAAEALFIRAYGAQSLPFIYVSAAVVIPVVGFVYLKLQQRIAFSTLLVGSLVLDGIALIALRVAATGTTQLVTGFIAVWFEIEWLLTSLALWGLANQLFDVRQSKRFYGFIGAGELVATIVGGFLTPTIVAAIGTAGLLLLSAGGVFVGATLVVYIARVFAPNLNAVIVEDASTKRAKPTVGDGKPYVSLIFALTFFSLLAYYFINNGFFASAQLRYPTQEALAGFIGVFFAAAGIGALFARLVLARWMFAKFGIRGGLIVLPIFFLICSVAIVACGATGAVAVLFWLACANKFVDTVGRGSLYENAVLSLFQALPAQRRIWAQTIDESQIEPLSGGIAGLIMIALNRFIGISVAQLAVAIVPLSLAWAVIAWRLRQRYIATLAGSLARRRFISESIVIDDESGLAQIKTIIAGDRAEDIVYAAMLLERSRHPYLQTAATTLLIRPEPLLRREAARIIQENALTDCSQALRTQLARESDAVVQGALVKALGAVSQSDSLAVLAPYLQSTEPAVRGATIVGLILAGGIEGVMVAGASFMSALRSADPIERRLAALVIGDLRNRQFSRPLLALLDDCDMRVRKAALAACSYVDALDVIRLAISNLRIAAVRRRAQAALTVIGDRAVAELAAAFADALDDRHFRGQIVAVLGHIKTPLAHGALVRLLATADPIDHHAIVQALRRGAYHAPPETHSVWHALLHAEAIEAAWTVAAADDLEGDEAFSLLVNALQDTLHRQQQHIVAILSFLYADDAVRSTYRHFASGSTEKHAYALEILDNVLSGEMHTVLFPILDQSTFAARRKMLDGHFPNARMSFAERLRDVAQRNQGRSAWLLACTLYTAGSMRVGELHSFVSAATTSCDPFVRETACRSLNQLERAHLNEAQPMSTTIEKVIVLRTVDIFHTLPDDYLVDIARRVEEIDIAADEKIIVEGEMGTALFIVADGAVRVHRGETILATLGPREIFGELTALDPEPRSADVTASEDSRVFKLDYEDLDEIMTFDVEVSRSIIKMLCRRLRASSVHVAHPSAPAGRLG